MSNRNEQDFFEEPEEKKVEEKKVNESASKLAGVCVYVLAGCVLSLLVACTIKVILWMF